MKRRADQVLVDRGLAGSRSEAQALIMAGHVSIQDRRIDKAGAQIDPDAPIHVAARSRFVSRGGDKLEGALRHFEAKGFAATGRVCLDVGASTGGFTDCLLQRGAKRVFAVDVGYGQLANRLRTDPRVDVRERVNARHLRREDFDEQIEIVVVDASFIAIEKLLPAIASVLSEGGHLVALVKPQFEAGREAVARGQGVIRDEATRLSAVSSARNAIERAGFEVLDEVDSEVVGPKGNRERFVLARRTAGGARDAVETDPQR